ncbi:hypothetical protein I5Q34_18225 [Streptomyces sp. AV19]|uniref:hypothetical protein n=1 Tax=Streptomyces sp. AV19 TaxID=2793068 RepID=UPI0018FE0CCE|nr:hypothetical protein [Streptomyces sp. AV19]MBH1936185.1 hypothetical protein [Streptomyces sp. AV19]MDG4534627.1 hypothetical protein [Streptomyces sp. AV19]
MSDTHPAPSADDHMVSTGERGSFCSARCTCGWLGPARRARSLARGDAEAHLAGTATNHTNQTATNHTN